MLRFVYILSALAVALPAAAQELPPLAPAPATAPVAPLAEIVLMEAPAPAAPDPATYAAAITGPLNAWLEAQRQLLEEQRAELEARRALLDQETALLQQQQALLERQAALTPPDEVTIPQVFQGDAAFSEQYGDLPDAFAPGLDDSGFAPGLDGRTFTPGPVDTKSDFFTTEDPPEPP